MIYEYFLSPSAWHLISSLILFYFAATVLYRLYLSPIAKFPGPKLAAVSFWYEFYYDVIKRGRYTWEIGRMHRKYGPIVRINPYELHIDDPEYYEELYSGSSKKRDRWEWSAQMFGNPTSTLGTVPHDHHRLRRGALNRFFSKRSVARLEPIMQASLDSLCGRFVDFQSSRIPFNLGDAFEAFSMDVIMEYAFAKSYHHVDEPDFAPEWPELLLSISETSALNKQFPWLLSIMKMMPEWLIRKLDPKRVRLINHQKDIAQQIQATMEANEDDYASVDHPTVFHELINSDLPSNEKTIARLQDEGQLIIGAGQMTTAHYLKTASFHILANQPILRTLKAELTSVMPNAGVLPPLPELEQLPYLSAVILEGFRLSYGVTQRLQRVSPDAPLVFRDWVIPAGTPVGMTSIFMHDNPELFPEPYVFRPERWLEPGAKERLEKYLVNFGKGSRACLGINLAQAEIRFTLAAIFRRFNLQLYETTRDDVDIVHDFFNPYARLDSKGVRVIVNSTEK